MRVEKRALFDSKTGILNCRNPLATMTDASIRNVNCWLLSREIQNPLPLSRERM